MQIVRASTEMGPRIWQIRNLALREGCRQVYDAEALRLFTPDEMPNGLLRHIRQHDFFVALDRPGGEPVATGFLDIEHHAVEAIFTLPAWQGKGLAGQIMDRIKLAASRRGIATLTLSATPNAVSFYQRHGFVIVRAGQYFSPSAQRNLDCVEMRWSRDISEHLQELEQRLLDAGAQGDREAANLLLAGSFSEIGSSGRVFDKHQVLSAFGANTGRPARYHWQLTDFSARPLAEGLYQARYGVTRRDADGQRENRSLRSSLWQLTDRRWQMIFHQGTPQAPTDAG